MTHLDVDAMFEAVAGDSTGVFEHPGFDVACILLGRGVMENKHSTDVESPPS